MPKQSRVADRLRAMTLPPPLPEASSNTGKKKAVSTNTGKKAASSNTGKKVARKKRSFQGINIPMEDISPEMKKLVVDELIRTGKARVIKVAKNKK